MRRLLPLAVLLVACPTEEVEETPEPATPSWCEEQGLTERPFIEHGVFGRERRDVADDFDLETTNGEWDFSREFTGCETYLFIPDNLTVSPLDSTPLVEKTPDLVELIEKSPTNVQYFFLTTRANRLDDFVPAMSERIEEALEDLDEDEHDPEYWAGRLHVVTESVDEISGWVDNAMTNGAPGFGIDRFQRLRGIGQLADVTRFSAALNNAGYWSWEANVAYVAHEAQYYNYRSDLQDRLDAVDWDVHHLWVDENMRASGRNKATVQLPDAATMATYDTLWVDLRHACDPSEREFGNCDAWDAGNRLHLCSADDPDVCDDLVSRWITTYHREGRWLVDASEALPRLAAGGAHTFRYQGARGGHFITARLLFANTGKGAAPFAMEPAFSGGRWTETYDEEHPPIEIQVPADATRTHLVVTVTGHGQGGDFNCAEFCRHDHFFQVGGVEYVAEHPTIGDREGCLNQIHDGTVPNQHGTWWFDRTSWCPGKQVDPWVFDITDQVTPGGPATISYTTNWGEPAVGGSINLQSWVTYWK